MCSFTPSIVKGTLLNVLAMQHVSEHLISMHVCYGPEICIRLVPGQVTWLVLIIITLTGTLLYL